MSKLNVLSSAKSLTTAQFLITTFLLLTISSNLLIAQNEQVIQVKAFNKSLEVYPNLQLSINQNEFFSLNSKGVAFISLNADDIPIRSVKPRQENLEAASWNLSKGILEVIIRKKSYIDKTILIVDQEGNVIKNQTVEYSGAKTISKKSTTSGKVTIPLALDEKINSASQFSIEEYNILQYENESGRLTVEKKEIVVPEKKVQPFDTGNKIAKEKVDWNTIIKNEIDSIYTLPAFYQFIKQIPIEEISSSGRKLIDNKFDSLMIQYQELSESDNLLEKINDSTKVKNDIDNLLLQVKKDGQRIPRQRIEFEEKINIVRSKLNSGFENLDKNSRNKLLADINALEEIILSNKSAFNENLDTYLQIINELKRRFFDLQELENKLSISEEERLKEKKIYRERLLLTLGLVLIFALLILLLFYLRARLKKQQRELIEANKVVKSTNENLEAIVTERTFLLQKTFKELDTVLYKASHDLRAPLCSLTGLSNLISKDTANEEVTDLMYKTNDQMDKLLKKLSVISEIHQAGEFEKVDLDKCINQSIEPFKEIITRRNINLITLIEQKHQVISIPKLIEFIVYHLTENALYFGSLPENNEHKVELSVTTLKNKLIIKVKDYGIGIEEIYKDKIFEMFYVGSTRSDGNGLGLYIVQKSTDLLNGKSTVNSVLNEYTEIIIELPINGRGSNTLQFLSSLNGHEKSFQLQN